MSRIVIFGTGDIARLASYYFSFDSEHEVVGFTVDREYLTTNNFQGISVVPFDDVVDHYPPANHKMFVALSYKRMNRLREDRYYQAKELGYELVSYVSSYSTFLSENPPGDNCFILESNTVQPYVVIGNNVTLWSGNHIGHDVIIGDHCFLASHVVVSGRVRIRNNCFIGVNATLRNAITLAPHSLVGAGAVIMEDTVANGVYVPPRARLLTKLSHEIQL